MATREDLPLACPFCGSESVGRMDGIDPQRPFYVRCVNVDCAGFGIRSGFAEPEAAVRAWNRRAQLPPARRERSADLVGFTKKDLIRGELVRFTLDRTGILESDAIAFSPHSEPLMKRGRENLAITSTPAPAAPAAVRGMETQARLEF
jgi:hypothetical protein